MLLPSLASAALLAAPARQHVPAKPTHTAAKPAHGATRHVASSAHAQPKSGSGKSRAGGRITSRTALRMGKRTARGSSRSGPVNNGRFTYSAPLAAHPTLVPIHPAAAAQEPVTAPQEPAAEAEASAAGTSSIIQQLAQGNSALRFPGALRHFFQALQRREEEPGNSTVRVMQWGDSHTAADMFTGELRARMQARFGDGGVGFTYAGHPFAGYRILGSGRGQSGGWSTLGTHFTQLGDGLLGMGGVAIESYRTGDTATLDAPCLTFDVHYLRQPGGGSFQLADNGMAVQTVSTAVAGASAPESSLPSTPLQATGDIAQPAQQADSASPDPAQVPEAEIDTGAVGNARGGTGGTLHYDCQAGSHHFTLTTLGGGPVRLLGTTALQPGISWESIGINGAEAPLMLRWNQPLFRGYLAAASPDLIVLAYGTNEAAARWTGENYRAAFARLIDTLHTTAPLASILVLGPGDRSLGSTSYTTVGRGRRARRIAHRYFVPYTGTDRILNAQREVCSTHNCAFWDWRARQGGLGAMNRWASSGYAQPDHTHLTGIGYRALADALAADLLSAYSSYEQDPTAEPTSESAAPSPR